MRILLADDHALFRRGLGLVLADMFGAVEVCEATTVDEVLQRLQGEHGVALVLLDLAMPGMSGHAAAGETDRFAGLRRIRAEAPATPVVMLSAYYANDDIATAIAAGANGYIPKSSSERLLKNALSLVLEGETYVPPSVLSAVGEAGQRALHTTLERLAPDNPLRTLTPRQREILGLLMRGQPNKEIGRNLGLLESTVKAHIKVILQKLEVSNRTQAAMLAAELGWPGGNGDGG